jgi:hypothetical protein
MKSITHLKKSKKNNSMKIKTLSNLSLQKFNLKAQHHSNLWMIKMKS